MEPMVVMAAKAAQRVGQEILKAHQNRHTLELKIESKGLDGLVTQVDRYSEELIIALLQESYPNHSFLGEEFGLQEGKGHDGDWCWVIDPLDGTHNFIHGIPHFCVSVGVQLNGVTQHGVIYDPVRDEMFSASRGKGARLNQRRINVSEHTTIDGGLFTTGHPLEKNFADGKRSLPKSILKACKKSVRRGDKYAVSAQQHWIWRMWRRGGLMAILRCRLNRGMCVQVS